MTTVTATSTDDLMRTLLGQTPAEKLHHDSLKLEADMLDAGTQAYLKQIRAAKVNPRNGSVRHNESNTSYGMSLLRDYLDPYKESILDWCRLTHLHRKGGRTPLALTILMSMDPDKVAYIASKTILDSLTTPQKKTTLSFMIVKRIVEEEYFCALSKDENTKKNFKYRQESLKERRAGDYQFAKNSLMNVGKKSDVLMRDIPQGEDLKLGDLLIKLFMKTTELVRLTYSYNRKKTTVLVSPTLLARDYVKDNVEFMAVHQSQGNPILVKPRPWSGPFNGGFHSEKLRKMNPLIHTHNVHQHKLLKASKFDYSWVNALQESKFRVNKGILKDMQTEVANPKSSFFALDETWRKIPIPDTELPIPERCGVKAVDRENMKEWYAYASVQDKELWSQYNETKQAGHTEKAKDFSKQMGRSRIIQTAVRYAKYDGFYFVVFLDSRGRAYTIGSLSPQGSDESKALLEPANAYPLGKTGYRHASLQVSATFGYDKEEDDDRLQWVEEHRWMIKWVAEDHLGNGYKHWKKSDKPWMFLKCCRYMVDIWEQQEMGFPDEAIMTRMIGAKDGTCNGIQHLSCMVGDKKAAHSVNIFHTGGKPQDIYKDVAEDTIKLAMAETDNPYAKIVLSLIIDRKTCKRQTMVLPYGGTMDSCIKYTKEWLMEKVKSLYAKDPMRTTIKENLSGIAIFLAKLIWKSLHMNLQGPLKALNIITKIGAAMWAGESTVGRPLLWITPNGFPAYMDKRAIKQMQVKTTLLGTTTLTYNKKELAIDKSAMASSLAPNFVHSTDACHEAKTIASCKKQGIDFFWYIHDDFGAPVGQCDVLDKTLRVEFHGMYSGTTPLQAFHTQQMNQWLKMKNARKYLPVLPPYGDLDIDGVLTSPYIFG